MSAAIMDGATQKMSVINIEEVKPRASGSNINAI
jgi:isoaspartyl peptidase/L-asparaginase-like protein (Ntn-hydrolase superfamily)